MLPLLQVKLNCVDCVTFFLNDLTKERNKNAIEIREVFANGKFMCAQLENKHSHTLLEEKIERKNSASNSTHSN